jgi:phage-related protein
MTTPVFNPTYPPSYSTAIGRKFRTLAVNFGDGYNQTIQDGLNNVVETWQLSWQALPDAGADDIEDQLTTIAGLAFEWTTPKGQTKRFMCGDVSRSYTGYGNNSVTAVFTETFSV